MRESGKVKIIIGTQWGDEGKGKITDYYASQADGKVLVARWQGGNNAGHTIKFTDESGDTKTLKLNYIPSGVARGYEVMLGHDMVIHPASLIDEINKVKDSVKFDPDHHLFISNRAHVTLDIHILEDGLINEMQGRLSAQSTLKGIAPTYADKAYRFGIRFGDLFNKSVLTDKISNLFRHKKPFFDANKDALKRVREKLSTRYGKAGEEIFERVTFDVGAEVRELLVLGEELTNSIYNTTEVIHSTYDMGGTIICEGAQGLMLDLTNGAYPYGTSSSITTGAACAGLGISPDMIDEVIGVVKVFPSRVGGGPLPTELYLDERLGMTQKQQEEFAINVGEVGTTTGRPRRLMWPDGVALRYVSFQLCNFDKIALTKLDVIPKLSEFTGVAKISTVYTDSYGMNYTILPPNWAAIDDWRGGEYRKIPLWDDLSEKEWIDLAQEGKVSDDMRKYALHISALAGVSEKNTLLSVGPHKDATFEFNW